MPDTGDLLARAVSASSRPELGRDLLGCIRRRRDRWSLVDSPADVENDIVQSQVAGRGWHGLVRRRASVFHA